jgi:hypothetical protein
MRLSADKNDPGFWPHQLMLNMGRRARVFQWGVEQPYVRTVDTEENLVEVIVTDVDGNVCLHPLRQNEVWTRVQRGVCSILVEDEEEATGKNNVESDDPNLLTPQEWGRVMVEATEGT